MLVQAPLIAQVEAQLHFVAAGRLFVTRYPRRRSHACAWWPTTGTCRQTCLPLTPQLLTRADRTNASGWPSWSPPSRNSGHVQQQHGGGRTAATDTTTVQM